LSARTGRRSACGPGVGHARTTPVPQPCYPDATCGRCRRVVLLSALFASPHRISGCLIADLTLTSPHCPCRAKKAPGAGAPNG
jgi:hypothetical protein